MVNTQRVVRGGFLVGLLALLAACIVAEPRDGYYDRDHNRYYREHTWHECAEHDAYCR